MIGLNYLDVLLHVPVHIRKGLASGHLTLWGSTVRDVQGRIRALLVEGRGLLGTLQHRRALDHRVLTDAIGHAQSAAQLASGISALNLGVSTAGFAVVRQQLDAIADQLDRALTVLARVEEGVCWIGSIQMAQIRRNIDSAFDMAVRAHRISDMLLFKDAKAKAFEVGRTLRHTMSMMIDERRAVARHEVFAEFARVRAILAVTEARCDEAVEGTSQASAALSVALNDLRDLVTKFNDQRRDFAGDPRTMVELGGEGRARVAACAGELLVLTRQVEGVEGQLEVQAAAGLGADAWRALTAPEGSGVLTCVAVPEWAGADLRDWVRAQPQRAMTQ
jgi:hypothetical protein